MISKASLLRLFIELLHKLAATLQTCFSFAGSLDKCPWCPLCVESLRFNLHVRFWRLMCLLSKYYFLSIFLSKLRAECWVWWGTSLIKGNRCCFSWWWVDALRLTLNWWQEGVGFLQNLGVQREKCRECRVRSCVLNQNEQLKDAAIASIRQRPRMARQLRRPRLVSRPSFDSAHFDSNRNRSFVKFLSAERGIGVWRW